MNLLRELDEAIVAGELAHLREQAERQEIVNRVYRVPEEYAQEARRARKRFASLLKGALIASLLVAVPVAVSAEPNIAPPKRVAVCVPKAWSPTAYRLWVVKPYRAIILLRKTAGPGIDRWGGNVPVRRAYRAWNCEPQTWRTTNPAP